MVAVEALGPADDFGLAEDEPLGLGFVDVEGFVDAAAPALVVNVFELVAPVRESTLVVVTSMLAPLTVVTVVVVTVPTVLTLV